MRILAVNKFYFLKGGSETCYFALNEMCRAHGMEVIPFSMADERNEASEYSDFFVRAVDYSDSRLGKKIVQSAKAIYSFEAARKVSALIRQTRPDLAHLHVFQHQLSPSIVHAIKRFELPIVNTAHDLKPLCPCYTMLNHGKVCELCKGGRFYHCLKNRCLKGSAAASLTAVLEMYLHRFLRSYSLIDAYITPSAFFKAKFIESGFPAEKVHHLRNFINCREYRGDAPQGDYFLYFGRLSAEKGIITLLEAMREVRRSQLVLAGDGPLKAMAEDFIRREKLENVLLPGFVSGRALKNLIEGCRFTVLPSEWYENCPMSVLESMACSKPVIGSAIGGIPELIEHEQNGLLFTPGDSALLAEQINRLLDNPAECEQMGRMSRARAGSEYSPEQNFSQIVELYNTLTGKYGRHGWKLSSY